MKYSAGFVGFDGTENKRTIPALYAVQEEAGIEGNINVLLRKPHVRARSTLSKFLRLYKVKPYITDKADVEEWGKYGVAIQGGYDDFFQNSDFVMVGTPDGKETPYIKSGLEYGSLVALMGGAKRPKLLEELKGSGFEVTDELAKDFGREFFFGLENYKLFQEENPQLLQCTSCNTTGICRLTKGAKAVKKDGPVLKMILGDLNRRQGDPHTEVKASPSAVSIGEKAGHQGKDAGTVFKDVRYSIRANKIPTTVPHIGFPVLIFEGEVTPAQLLDSLAGTREVVVMPFKDGDRKHEWTSDYLEAFLSGFERPISPEIFELLVPNAVILDKLDKYTLLQVPIMVEQMSIAVPNHVEAYLMGAGLFSRQSSWNC